MLSGFKDIYGVGVVVLVVVGWWLVVNVDVTGVFDGGFGVV